MAITKDFTVTALYRISDSSSAIEELGLNEILEKEIILEDAYIRVKELRGNKNLLTINVSIHKTHNEPAVISEMYQFEPDLESEMNFIGQAYQYLKTLDQFNDAVDC